MKRRFRKRLQERKARPVREITQIQHKDHILLFDHPVPFRSEQYRSGSWSGEVPHEIGFITDQPLEGVLAGYLCYSIGPCAIPSYKEYFSEWKMGLTVIYPEDM